MRFLYTYSLGSPVSLVITAALLFAGTHPATAAPHVRLDTVLGNIDIELLHEEAPLTVTNFLKYIVTDRYDEMFFHRSVPGFVVQGGGYTYPAGGEGVDAVPEFDPVINEFDVSNTRGTVAMAKLPNDPNSATSEFFFNLGDNSQNLDNQNGGFTVFGRVVASSMDLVDQIAGLSRVDAGSPFNTLPVRDYTPGSGVTRDNLIIVNDVQVLPTGIPGDYNANGLVEQQDLDLVLANWGASATQLPAGWFQDLPSGTIDQTELDGVLANWGDSAGEGSALAAGSVPEPATWLLAAIALPLLAGGQRLRRARAQRA